jgi:hypothetical protein
MLVVVGYGLCVVDPDFPRRVSRDKHAVIEGGREDLQEARSEYTRQPRSRTWGGEVGR